MLGAGAAILFVGIGLGSWWFGEKQDITNPRAERPPKK